MSASLPLMTVSRQRSYRSCVRRHHYRYDMQVESVATFMPARFGTLFHEGLEYYELALANGLPHLSSGISAIRTNWTTHEDPCPFELAKAEELFTGYHARWEGDSDWEILAVEAEFRMPLVNPDTGAKSRTYTQAGKIDLIVRHIASGLIYIVEHKTTSLDITPGSAYWERLRIDDQIATYIDGARSLGYDVAGCIYDVALRPSQKPQHATPEEDREYTKFKPAKPGKPCPTCKARAQATAKATRTKLLVKDIQNTEGCPDCTLPREPEEPRLYSKQRADDETPTEFSERIREAIAKDPDKYYQRGTVVRLDTEMQDARWDTWHTARMIRETELANRHTRNPSSCVQFGNTCAFFDVCTGSADITDPHRFRRKEKAHSELSDTFESPKEEDTHHDSNSSSPISKAS